MHSIQRTFAVVAVGGALLLSACGGTATTTGPSTAAPSTTPTTASAFPMTIENCGHSVTIKKAPQKIVAVNDDPVRNIATAGGLDKIVAVAGLPGDPVFDSATVTKIKNLPMLSGPSGTLSTESILSTNADLVIGTADNLGLTFEQLQTVGIPLLVTPGYCKTGTPERADFTLIQNITLLFGEIFGTEDQAKQSVANIQSRLAEIKRNLKSATTERTGAALFISGSKLSAYGNLSMSHTQLGLLGLRNVFGDVEKRIFEVNVEEVIKRNPDYIEVLTYPEPGKPAPTLADLKAFPGMADVTAVKNDHVVFIPFAYSAQSSVAVDGLQRLATGFGLLK